MIYTHLNIAMRTFKRSTFDITVKPIVSMKTNVPETSFSKKQQV
jgi:hypothetical protein